MKAQRKDMCSQLLEHYNAEGEEFLQRILTGDESWVRHYDPESLKQRLRRVRRDKDSILQHDNARPHTSRQTQDALRQLELTTLPHPACRPDFAPLTIICFTKKGHHDDNDEEVIADARRWCRGQSFEFFADGVRQHVKR
ncbi:histone-lysine N-methyltransferase SETMAR [Plakobranchus ocellatus]|uniref:Histone-lysine N-methyltransferase SETMAR n=1 Tax=Plakobranchus ocellatus TaxID=259542 RepID=A0AAV4DU55_9GAST|nr:histone-lysine N-methyltransferase SETMAR [Plakobranchus ocellatus]